MEEDITYTYPVRRRWLSTHESQSQPGPESKSLARFSVMTYNLLAQTMVKREVFPFASDKSLKRKHRIPNLLREIFPANSAAGGVADVLCFQEMDVEMFNDFLPHFQKHNYEARFVSKRNEKKHSIAIAWKTSKFELLRYEEIDFNDLALEKEEASELEVGNVAQMLALRCSPSSGTQETKSQSTIGVIISNTHLFWNPLYSYTRTMQAYLLLDRIHRMSQLYPFPIIMAGDFNSTPNNCVFRFMTERKFEEAELTQFLTPLTHKDWKSRTEKPKFLLSNQYLIDNHSDVNSPENVKRMKRVKQVLEDAAARLPMVDSVYKDYARIVPEDIHSQVMQDYKIPSIMHPIGHPPFTTFGPEWSGCIDHILIGHCIVQDKGKDEDKDKDKSQQNGNLVCSHVLEIPTSDVVKENVGLPDERFSSDHLSLIAVFQWFPSSSSSSSSSQ